MTITNHQHGITNYQVSQPDSPLRTPYVLRQHLKSLQSLWSLKSLHSPVISSTTQCAAHRGARSAFTLFEILLVLALIAVVGAATIPFWYSSQPGEGEAISREVRQFVRALRRETLKSREPHRMRIVPLAIEADTGTNYKLPEGWVFEVQRFDEKRFREPSTREIWEVTSEGLLEPLSLVARTREGYQILIEFCSLTALEPRK